MKHPVFLHCLCLSAALALLLLISPLTIRAQAPAWQSAIAISTINGASQVTATAADASGNVYIAGSFTADATFGSISLTAAPSTQNLFVAKWSRASDAFVWAQRVSGSSISAGGLAVNGANIYLAGSFYTSATFGSIILTTSWEDTFVAKLTDAGNSAAWAWVQRSNTGAAAPQSYVEATSIAVNGTSVYVAGSFTGPVAGFGSTTLTNASPNTTSNRDIFVAKLSDAGASASWVWAQRAGGTEADIAKALAANGSNVYVAGTFNGTAQFGTARVNAYVGTYGTETFVAKLTDAGSSSGWTWAQQTQAGGTTSQRSDQPRALAVNGTSVYVAGSFNNNIQIGGTYLTSAGSTDAYIAKLTDIGSSSVFAWAQRAGGPGSFDQGEAVAVNGTSVYMAGYFAGTATFGSFSLTSTGSSNTFVVKLIDAGNNVSYTAALRAGGTDYDRASALVATATGVYVAGKLTSRTANFGSLVLTHTGPSGYEAGYLAKLTDPSLTATVSTQSINGLNLYPNPAHQSVTLVLPASMPDSGPASLTIFDSLGRTIRTQEVVWPAAGIRHDLDLHGLPAGIYTLRLLNAAAHAVRQLVVN